MVEELIIKYGYIIVFLGALVEGEIIILLSSFYAAKGMLNIYIIFGIVVFCSIFIDQISFYIGYKYGHYIHEKFLSRFKTISNKALKLARNYIVFYTLIFRFIPGIRTISPFIIGYVKFNRLYFAILNIIAALVWASIICAGGYILGEKFKSKMLFLGIIFMIIVFIFIKSILFKVINYITNEPKK